MRVGGEGSWLHTCCGKQMRCGGGSCGLLESFFLIIKPALQYEKEGRGQ